MENWRKLSCNYHQKTLLNNSSASCSLSLSLSLSFSLSLSLKKCYLNKQNLYSYYYFIIIIIIFFLFFFLFFAKNWNDQKASDTVNNETERKHTRLHRFEVTLIRVCIDYSRVVE